MRIAFVNPPFLARFSREQRSPAVTKSGTFYYPMWLSYAAGYSEKAGHKVRLWDAPASGVTKTELVSSICSFCPKLVVIATSTPSIYNDVDVGAQIKEVMPRCFVVLVGVHVSALPSETLALHSKIDGVIRGEYEETVAELASVVEGGRTLNGISGLVYRGPNGVVDNGIRMPLMDLDAIPWVTWAYKKWLRYRDYFYSGNLYPIVVFTTSRGCPSKCCFCVYPQTFTGHRVRYRSVGDVVDEMAYVRTEFKPLGEIMFEDDTLTINKKRTIEFCEEILRRNLKIRWSCNARAQLDLETLRILKRSGCRSLLVGFESGSQEVLNGMHKGTILGSYLDFVKNCKKLGLLVNGTFLVGCPGETKESMTKTIGLAKRLKPDVAQFYPVMVYPGTELYEEYRRKGFMITDNFRHWLNAEGLHNCVVNLPGLSAAEMVRFCDFCRRSFYLRLRYVLYKAFQSIRSPSEAPRNLRAAGSLLKHLIRGSKPETVTMIEGGKETLRT